MGLQSSQPNKTQQPHTNIVTHPEDEKFLYCVACHHPITRPTDRIVMNEHHEHVFANPHGYIYQIGCFAQATGCVVVGQPSSQFSWFPGYSWQVALCKQCWTMLGWAFRTNESLFWGLIVNKLKD